MVDSVIEGDFEWIRADSRRVVEGEEREEESASLVSLLQQRPDTMSSEYPVN